MEVRPVLTTPDKVRAEAACEELRAHGIKCDTIEPNLPFVREPFMRDPGVNVVVAPEDEGRAMEILADWR